MLAEDAYQELLRLSNELMTACDQLLLDSKKSANTEHEYRRAKAIAYLNSEGTVQARQAMVDKVCSDKRIEAHLAEAIREAGLERIRSLRSVISAYQSYLSANKAEVELATYSKHYENI